MNIFARVVRDEKAPYALYKNYKGKWEMSVGEVTVSGESKAEVREKMNEEIHRRFSYVPRHPALVFHGEYGGLLWDTGSGFNYTVFYGREVAASGFVGFAGEEYEAALQTMLFHLAQSAWSADNPGVPEFLRGEKRSIFESWAAWQLRYIEGIKQGLSHENARA